MDQKIIQYSKFNIFFLLFNSFYRYNFLTFKYFNNMSAALKHYFPNLVVIIYYLHLNLKFKICDILWLQL